MHRDEKIVEKMVNKSIHAFYLPPNTSHFLQPLDDLPFAIYKSELRRLADAFVRARKTIGGHTKNATEIGTLVSIEAGKLAFAPGKIQEGFANTGIWPWNPERILEHANLNVGIFEEKKKMGDINEKVVELSRNAWSKKIQIERRIVETLEASKERVTVTAKYKEAFDAHSLLTNSRILREQRDTKEEEKRRKTEEKERKRLEREESRRARFELQEAKKNHSCRVKGCKRKWDESFLVNWVFCEACDKYAVCPVHWDAGESGVGQMQMKGHEVDCMRVNKKARLDVI
jgi:hypothetical protein